MPETYLPAGPNTLYCRHNTIRGDRPSILLIHGLGESGLCFSEIFDHEIADDFNVVIPDLVGYGRSSRSATGDYGFATHLDGLRQVIDRFELRRMTVVGHSLGGDLATLLCSHYGPEKIERLVSVEGNLTAADLFISAEAAGAEAAGSFDRWFHWDFIYRRVYGLWCPRWPFGRRYLAALGFCDPRAFSQDASEMYQRNHEPSPSSGGALYRSLPIPKTFLFGQKSLAPETREFLHHHRLPAYQFIGSHHWPMIECATEFYAILNRCCAGEEVGRTVALQAPPASIPRHLVAQVDVPTVAEYEDPAVQLTLDASNAPRLIREAREAQDRLLRRRYLGKPLRIADIGCGDGYHAEIFAPHCSSYHGYEISEEMVMRTRERCVKLGLTNVDIRQGDVLGAKLGDAIYDVVWCLYFTPGNLRARLDGLAGYDDAYLDSNTYFINIIARFCAALAPDGSLFLTVYKDNPQAEEAQRAFYWRTGQFVLTDIGSRFVATDKGFWSLRWGREDMLRHLAAAGVPEKNVVFHELNEIAWLVEARKRYVSGR